MNIANPTEAVCQAMPQDCPERRFVLGEINRMVGEGWNVSSVRMNIHSEVFANLWRTLREGEQPTLTTVTRKDTGEPVKVEFMRFFSED